MQLIQVMAKEEKFLLVSLEEKESKKLAQVISNNSSRRILSFLAQKNATESELSKELGIPISTVHYNLKHLIKSGLVDAKEYHYSEKGKEVNHYSLAKKYIVIAPSTAGIKTRLKNILPMAVIIAAGAALIHLMSSTTGSFGAVKTAEETVPMLAETAITGAEASAGLPISLWFLFGGIAVIIVYLIIILIKSSKI